MVEETSDELCIENEKVCCSSCLIKQLECVIYEVDCMNEMSLEKQWYMSHRELFEVCEYECEVCDEHFKTKASTNR